MTEATAETVDHEETTGAIAQGGERPADEPTAAADNSRAVAVVQKQRIIATSDVAIWDTAAFDHMGRVGALMAASKLASPTIYEGVDVTGATSRMVMIANLARECGANPLMFLQGCSIISNKLHLEGKIVSAIITARTGIKLRYRFGVWKDGGIVFPETQQDAQFFNGAGENLAVRVEDPEDPDRFVDGFVGLWKTERKGSPWSAPANWRRQLRYRGAPEWARAYEPGAVLGFYSDADEDVEEFEGPKPRQKRDLAGKLAAPKAEGEAQEGAQGFNRAGVAEALGDGASEAARGSGDVVECEHEFSGEGEDRACDHCGQLESDARPTMTGADTGTGGVQNADAGQATSGSAAGASDAIVGPEAIQGPAPAGETYFMFGDAVGADGKRATYKDGVAFSSTKVLTKFKAYTEHAPPVTAGEPETTGDATTASDVDLDVPCEACGAPAGEPCAEDCPGEVEATISERQADAGIDLVKDEPETGPLAVFKGMKSWPDEFKPALAALFKTSDWMSGHEDDKNAMRRAIWGLVVASGAKVDHADDPSAYGLWIAAQGNTRDDADAVEGTFNTLQRGERWGKMSVAARKPLEDRTSAKLKSIRGGNG